MKKLVLILAIVGCVLVGLTRVAFCLNDFQLIYFDSGTNTIFAIYDYKLVRINPSTGAMTVIIADVHDPDNAFRGTDHPVDVANHLIYTISTREDGCHITWANWQTGTITEGPAIHY